MVQQDTERRYYYGTGKRKTSIAKVRLYETSDPSELAPARRVQVNGKPIGEVIPWPPWQILVQEPLKVVDSLDKFIVVAMVQGGGVSSQAQAIRHGIAKALVVYDEAFKGPLRKQGLLTRDARIKERKKYGLKRARRAPQYTKR